MLELKLIHVSKRDPSKDYDLTKTKQKTKRVDIWCVIMFVWIRIDIKTLSSVIQLTDFIYAIIIDVEISYADIQVVLDKSHPNSVVYSGTKKISNM